MSDKPSIPAAPAGRRREAAPAERRSDRRPGPRRLRHQPGRRRVHGTRRVRKPGARGQPRRRAQRRADRVGDGQRGRQAQDLADEFMEDNPGVKVNVTPVDWGQAVAKLQTAIAGGQTPDVSQMGTDMMGQFARDRRPRAGSRPTSTRAPSSRAPGTRTSSTGPCMACRGTSRPGSSTTGPTSPRRPASPTPPATWDDLTAMAKAMQDKGGAKWGICARHQELAGVLPVPVVQRRRRHRRRRASPPSTARRPSRP